MLQRGLRFHPDSRCLWREYFKFELAFTSWRRSLLEKNSDEVSGPSSGPTLLDGLLPVAVFKAAMRKIDSFSFCSSFLETLDSLDGGDSFPLVEETVVEFMKTTYGSLRECVIFLAERLLRGMSPVDDKFYLSLKDVFSYLNESFEVSRAKWGCFSF